MIHFTSLIEFAVFVILLIVCSPLLGAYFHKVFFQKSRSIGKVNPLERGIYKFLRIDPEKEMGWKQYLLNLLIFNFIGFVFLFLLQITQNYLPYNPQNLKNVDFILAFNTAVSFVTNTNWQSYSGEVTLSYLVQTAGLTVQNFLSAASGLAVLLALVRGIVQKQSSGLGNFWNDIVKAVLYVFLPLSVVLSILLVSQGVVQNNSGYTSLVTMEGKEQIIPQGPAASQVAIKQLGTNGGGFFGTNSAYPSENPTPFSNFLQLLSILLIPASLVFMYGKVINSKKHGWVIFGSMLFLFLAGFIIALYSESSTNPILQTNHLMEGKEVRFGVFNSVLWSTATTAASNGAVNSMHSSLSPLAGFVQLLFMTTGEVVFGGVGSGLYGILIFILVTVFISGLMVGRTPEYQGKKIAAYEIKWAIVALLLPNAVILLFTALALATGAGTSSTLNTGPHGFSEVLYTFSSAAGNNGSSFAGLNANTSFYNALIGIAMILGRYGVIIPCIAIAGSLAKKNITPVGKGTIATDTLLFAFLLVSVILVVGALTFFPALSLGPILEHLLLISGKSF